MVTLAKIIVCKNFSIIQDNGCTIKNFYAFGGSIVIFHDDYNVVCM